MTESILEKNIEWKERNLTFKDGENEKLSKRNAEEKPKI